MSRYGQWVTATIAVGASESSAIDLGIEYDNLSVRIPRMDKCKMYLQVAEVLAGPYQDLGRETTTDLETFDRGAAWILGGFRYIKVCSTEPQMAERLIRVKGMRY